MERQLSPFALSWATGKGNQAWEEMLWMQNCFGGHREHPQTWCLLDAYSARHTCTSTPPPGVRVREVSSVSFFGPCPFYLGLFS